MMSSVTLGSIAELLAKYWIAVTVIMALPAALLIWYRSRSTHMLLRWLWNRVAGKQNASDVDFNDFMNKQDNLMQFRFISGKARTVAQMHSLIIWSGLHNESVQDMKACGPYFDREKPGLVPIIRRDKQVLRVFLALIWGLCATGMLFIAVLLLSNKSPLTFTDSGKWLMVDRQSARSLVRPGTERLASAECAKPLAQIAKTSGFNEREIKHLCELYADPKQMTEFIDDNIAVTRYALILPTLYILALFIVAHRYLAFTKAALDMHKRLHRPRP